MCTVLDRVENIGIQKGIQKGIQIGKQEGIQIGKQEGIQLGKQEGIQLGKQEGIQLGKQEGIQLGQQQLLDRILENLSLEELAKFTNIPLAELKQFRGRSDK